MRGIEGAVALVTGAGCPPEIGRATALRLARSGADVVVADRLAEPGSGDVGTAGLPDSACTTPDALDAVADEIRALGRRALAVPIDAADPASVAAALDATVAEFGHLDLCAHVQGGLGPELGWGDLLDVDAGSWQANVELNLSGAFHVARLAARRMLDRPAGTPGAIVLLGSFATVAAKRGSSAFAVAKAGVDRLVVALAHELAPHGIRVNGVRPLGVDPATTTTGHPFLERTIEASRGEAGADQWVLDHIALGRLQHPDETAAVIEFLLSTEASFVTGEVITTAGGGRM